jgi:polysaccharide pyruvyl transferase CsaB
VAERVLIGGYYGFGNLGDEALLYALLRSLRERLPHVEPVVLSQAPGETARAYGTRAISRWNPLRIWRELGRARLFLLGGGGLLQDTTSLRSALYYLGLLRLARLRRVPVFLIGQGVGPLRRRFLRQLAVRELKRAECVMVRDELSLKLLQEWGADRGQLLRGHDLALGLPFEAPPRAQAADLLGISLREPLEGERGRFIAAVAAGLEEAHRRFGLRPTLFPLFPREDLRLAEEVRRAMNVGSLVIDLAGLPLAEALAIVGQTRLMVGMRLHALEFAFITGVPFLALSYDLKVEEFARTVEKVTELPIPLVLATEATAEALLAGLEELRKNEAEYRAKLALAAPQLRQQANAALEEAFRRMAKALEARKPKRRTRGARGER